MTDAYSEDEFYNDILRVTGGQTNEQLARTSDHKLNSVQHAPHASCASP